MQIFAPSMALGAALILVFPGSALLAQDQPAAGAPPPAATSQAPSPAAQQAPSLDAQQAPPLGAQPNRAPDPKRQVKMMARRLALTPKQQSKIEPILADRQQQLENVRADTTLAPRNRRMMVQAIRQDSDSKIEALLSDVQKQQYEQMKQEQRANGQMREEQQAGVPPTANNL
jgi:periplasmic protein CpxP/Spy